MKRCYLLLTTFLVVGILGLAGCGEKKPPGMPKLCPTKITVTFDDGAIIPDAAIILSPDDTGKVSSWSYTGNTDSSGTASIWTQGRYNGLPAGKYKVRVTKGISEGAPNPGTPVDAESAKRFDEWKKNPNKQKWFKVIAPEYDDPLKTPLEVTIETKGNNSFAVKVGKEVRIRLPDPY